MFRAYDSRREHLVAVKLFKLDLSPDRVRQLAAELDRMIAADLAHPALARPLQAGIHDVCAYLVQDYVAAEPLDVAVREYGPAPAADVLRVAAQLAGALDEAAAANITHGSLHPRDVLLSSDVTRLTGMGVARALERVGVEAPVRRPYTAPERTAGGHWDRRADVFSLAALVHELLWARRVSGTGARAVESLTEVGGGNLSALRAAFARALAEDPAERFETATGFADALRLGFPSITLASPEAIVDRRPSKRTRAAKLESPLPLLDEPTLERAAARTHSSVTPPASPQVGELRGKSSEQDAGGGGFFEGAEQDAAPVDLALSSATPEEERFHDVEAVPAIVDVDTRSRTAMWPLTLALIAGLTIGFAGGYRVGTRDRPAAITTAASQGAAPPVAAGREFTEAAVAAPAKPAALTSTAPAAAERQATDAARTLSPATGNHQSAISNRQFESGPGRLLVRSTPPGARVFVDGREYGQTPAEIRNLAPGPHRVQIARDGYATDERRVVVAPSQPAQSITVALERPRVPVARTVRTTTDVPPTTAAEELFTGVLVVDSRPVGASVFMDGELVGATPLALPTVRVGEHLIRLERDGYRRWSSSVRVVASERNRVTASLER